MLCAGDELTRAAYQLRLRLPCGGASDRPQKRSAAGLGTHTRTTREVHRAPPAVANRRPPDSGSLLQMYSGGSARGSPPNKGGVNTPSPDNTFTADLPSVHYAADGEEPEPEPEPEQRHTPSPRWDPSRDDIPHITKQGITLDGAVVRFSSPRCKTALLETGVLPKQLQPKTREAFTVGAKFPEVVEKRFLAYEELRRKNVSTLVKRRAELVAQADAREREKQSGIDSTMLEMERQHKAKILEAAKRRMYEEQQRTLQEEKKKDALMESQRQLDEVLTKRVVEREQTIVERREAAERERLRRSRMKREKEHMDELQARQIEQLRKEQEAKIAQELAMRQAKMRERGLRFAEVQAQKLEEIAAMNRSKEEAKEVQAEESAEKAARKQAEREYKMSLMKEKITDENRQRSAANERKRLRRKAREEQKLKESSHAILAKLERVDKRLEEVEQQKQAERAEKKRVEEYKERERKRKLDIIERSYTESAGASQGKTQEKEAAIEKAARRRAAQLEIRAEESRLKFEAKRENIERQKRVKQHEQFLAMLQQQEKNERLDGESRPFLCPFLPSAPLTHARAHKYTLGTHRHTGTNSYTD